MDRTNTDLDSLGDLINDFRLKRLGLDPVSPLWGHQLLSRLHVEYTYLWSKSLIPKPSDWGAELDIAGFSFLPLGKSYTPDQDLADFLAAGPAPIYIGFGSIIVDDPTALTNLIFAAVQKAGVRAIVSKGWGGMGGGDKVPESVYLIGNVPHDWLFQRVSCVVHHGGAGTTAAGIAAGLPTVVVPFFGDQPFWGQMIAKAGAGPVPVPFKLMTADTLANSITQALSPEIQKHAKLMADKIAVEDGATRATERIDGTLNSGLLRCEIYPDRVASWETRRGNIRVCTKVISALVSNRIMRPEDFKLLRHKDWYVDEGPAHFILGIVAAGAGIFHRLGQASTDYSARLRQSKAVTEEPSKAPLRRHGSSPEKTDRVRAHANGDLRPLQENWTPQQLEKLMLKLASKSPATGNFDSSLVANGPTKPHSRSVEIVRATGRFALDIASAGVRAPVALCYNVACGCHNFPSYISPDIPIRRRSPITGFKSGCKVAGKEFGHGVYDAFTGLVLLPVKGGKRAGIKGAAKGALLAPFAFTNNMAAGKSHYCPGC
jgi:sterol 3beta-glucosyltransferase